MPTIPTIEDQQLALSYDNVIDHIRDGYCVLILGPQLSVSSEGVGYKRYFKELVKAQAPETLYFEEENLFGFQDEFSRKKITRELKQFYEHAGDEVLLELLSRIRFSLVINACPDTALNRMYRDKGIDEFKEGYFAINSKQDFNDLPKPSKEVPVIYNILGNARLDQSMILTHGQLFETLEYLLPKNSLPDNVEYYINNKAQSFLFLGFDFRSWHYQLICHKLGLNPKAGSKEKIATTVPKASVKALMSKSFEMTFTRENSYQCVHSIIARLEGEPGELRQARPGSRFAIFVSYAWSDASQPNRDFIVQLIQQRVSSAQRRYSVWQDKRDLRYGDSIDAFMHTIGAGKTVILVVTDKYLKSEYCMTEALRAWDYQDDEHRKYIVMLDDAQRQIASDNGEGYKRYWFEKCQAYLNDPGRLDKKEFDSKLDIYRFIDRFIADIKDRVNFCLKFEDLTQAGDALAFADPAMEGQFQELVNQLTLRMQQ